MTGLMGRCGDALRARRRALDAARVASLPETLPDTTAADGSAITVTSVVLALNSAALAGAFAFGDATGANKILERLVLIGGAGALALATVACLLSLLLRPNPHREKQAGSSPTGVKHRRSRAQHELLDAAIQMDAGAVALFSVGLVVAWVW